MQREATLSNTARTMTWAMALLYTALGIPLFFFPGWSAERFAWSVTDFQTMTVGAWCLGNGFAAWYAARDWRWPRVYPVLGYLWIFSLVQTVVLVWHVENTNFDRVLTYPYLAALGVGMVAGVVGLADVLRRRPSPEAEDYPAPAWLRVLAVAFVLSVGFLAAKTLLDVEAGARRNVFPEVLTPFTIRAFGGFYLALTVGALLLVPARTMAPYRCYTLGQMGVLVATTAAAYVYLGVFDFSERPGQLIYIGAYTVVLLAAVVVTAYDRRRISQRARHS